jgi:hypothetical protein
MDDLEIALVLRTTVPATWSVEAMEEGNDGAVEMAQFSGPCAEQRAREYAIWKYGVRAPAVMAA